MSSRAEDPGTRLPSLPPFQSSRLPPFSRGAGTPLALSAEAPVIVVRLPVRALQGELRRASPSHAAAALGLRRATHDSRYASDAPLVGVSCPRAGHPVPLAECARCPECDGVVTSREGGSTAVACLYCPPGRRASPGAGHATRGTEPEQEREPAEAGAAPPSCGALDPASHTAVTQIMTSKVTSVSPTLSARALAELFLAEGLSGAPVVDGNGHPIGIVTKTDLLASLVAVASGASRKAPAATRQGAVQADAAAADVPACVAACGDARDADTAGDHTPVAALMQSTPILLRETDSVARAAAVMAFEGLHRLPVVAVGGAVIGMVSSLDVLNWLALQSGYAVAEHARRRPGSTPPPPLGVPPPLASVPLD